MQRRAHPSRPVFVASPGQAPPGGIRQPSQGEGVIQVKPEAGVDTGDFYSLRGCGRQRPGMTPAVLEVKGADHVRQESHQAKRPPVAAAWPGTTRTAAATGQREHIPREGEECRQSNRPLGTVHTPCIDERRATGEFFCSKPINPLTCKKNRLTNGRARGGFARFNSINHDARPHFRVSHFAFSRRPAASQFLRPERLTLPTHHFFLTNTNE